MRTAHAVCIIRRLKARALPNAVIPSQDAGRLLLLGDVDRDAAAGASQLRNSPRPLRTHTLQLSVLWSVGTQSQLSTLELQVCPVSRM